MSQHRYWNHFVFRHFEEMFKVPKNAAHLVCESLEYEKAKF